jgi:hypothetical protein
MILAVVGYRDFHDYAFVSQALDQYITEHGRPEAIVSGGATGVDTLAERYAREHNIRPIVYPANFYEKGYYDASAGPRRNTLIVRDCTAALAFPQRGGKGTQDTIKQLERAGKPCKVIWLP